MLANLSWFSLSFLSAGAALHTGERRLRWALLHTRRLQLLSQAQPQLPVRAVSSSLGVFSVQIRGKRKLEWLLPRLSAEILMTAFCFALLTSFPWFAISSWCWQSKKEHLSQQETVTLKAFAEAVARGNHCSLSVLEWRWIKPQSNYYSKQNKHLEGA